MISYFKNKRTQLGISKETLLVLGILVVASSIFFYDVVFLGKTFKLSTVNSQAMHYGVFGQEDNKPSFIPSNVTDPSVLEEPIYEFIRQNLKKGIVPLWNPHQACGYALIGMIQVGMFFPLNLILYLLPSLYSWDIFILVRIIIGGLFAYWFMRTLRFKQMPSLCSAIVYMFTGPMILMQTWVVNVEIIAPLLLLCVERLINKPKMHNIAFVGAAIALTFFGGHPEHIFFVNVIAFLFLCFRVFTLRNRINLKKVTLSAVAAYILGIGLSAMVFFPFLRNYISEIWHAHPKGTGLLLEEVRSRILTLAIPHFFQREPMTFGFQRAGWWGGYLGIVPLALAFLSFFSKQRKGLNYFFGIVAFVLIGKVYNFPIINWIGYLPIFRLCRFAIHTPFLIALAVAILSGMGIRVLESKRNMFARGIMFSGALVCVLTVYLFIFRESGHFKQSVAASIFTVGILAVFLLALLAKDRKWVPVSCVPVLIVMIVSIELLFYVQHQRPNRYDSFPKVPYLEFLRSQPQPVRAYGMLWAFYPNTATGYEVDDFGFFLGMLPNRYVNSINNLFVKDFFERDLRLRPPALRVLALVDTSPMLDVFNIQYFIAQANPFGGDSPSISMKRHESGKRFRIDMKISKRTKLIYRGEVDIYKRMDALPRVFIVHRALFEPDTQRSYTLIQKVNKQLREVVVINDEMDKEVVAQLATSPVIDKSQAAITKYTPNEVIVRAYLENPGILVFGDAYHPDWKVYVDDNPSKLYAAYYLGRGVFLPKGSHHVRFVFRPLSFYLGLAVSGICLVITVILIFLGSRTRREAR